MHPQPSHHPQGPPHLAGFPSSIRLIRQWQARQAVPALVFWATSSTEAALPTTMAVRISCSVIRSQKQITVSASPSRIELSEGCGSDIERGLEGTLRQSLKRCKRNRETESQYRTIRPDFPTGGFS